MKPKVEIAVKGLLQVVGFVIVLGAATSSLAQNLRTTVQLPTISVFSVDTTVSVPDRGGMWLGSIGRRSEGRTEFGPRPFSSRPALGVQSGFSGVQVSATIIDLEELDRQVMAQARSQSLAVAASLDESVNHSVQRAVGRAADVRSEGPGSLAEIRQRQAAEQNATQREGEDYLERALAAEDDGKLGAAKAYYQMAARRLTGELKQEALKRLAELRGGNRGEPRGLSPR